MFHLDFVDNIGVVMCINWIDVVVLVDPIV